MRLAAWYGIAVGAAMLLSWGLFLATGNVPELETAPFEIAFHLAAEFATALGLIVSGSLLLKRRGVSVKVFLAAAGMLTYSVIASAGYFAERDQWGFVAMFGVLLVLTVLSMARAVDRQDHKMQA